MDSLSHLIIGGFLLDVKMVDHRRYQEFDDIAFHILFQCGWLEPHPNLHEDIWIGKYMQN